VVVSTYQAVSGNGKESDQRIRDPGSCHYNQQEIKKEVYPHQIAFNCLPHIDVFFDNGYTKEEIKMVNETKKIMEDNSIGVTATTVRVPVFYGHSESVNIETEKKLNPDEVRKILSKAPGVVVVDNPKKFEYPLAIHAAGKMKLRRKDSRDESISTASICGSLQTTSERVLHSMLSRLPKS